MSTFPIMVANRSIRLFGNIIKTLSYPFHFLLPKARFTIPEYSPAKVRSNNTSNITKVIWQTNYSNRSTLPIYVNYLFNRLMSLDYDYRYVSTEAREQYIKEHAPKSVYESYLQLSDGAAQADLWRVFTLWNEGGIYMDIDASFVWPLKRILKDQTDSLYITIKKDTEITNYFLATKPKNPEYEKVLSTIVKNIENYDPNMGIYGTTGPRVFNDVLERQLLNTRRRRYVAIQGAFSNEHFQYLDKPKGKWTHLDPNDLIKK